MWPTLILGKSSCSKLQTKPATPSASNDLQHRMAVSFIFHFHTRNKGGVVSQHGHCSWHGFIKGVRPMLKGFSECLFLFWRYTTPGWRLLGSRPGFDFERWLSSTSQPQKEIYTVLHFRLINVKSSTENLIVTLWWIMDFTCSSLPWSYCWF